jgi:hypothetical protein
MASIYIINHTICAPYPETWSSYHHTEIEASDAYNECMESATYDENLIELIRLDTETLDAVTIKTWSGTGEDLEDEGPEDGEEGFEDEDDGIVEGSP